MQLDGKKAIVTGGASGIGKATALELARAGAQVYLGDIDEAGAAAVEKEAKKDGLKVEFVKLDLTNEASIDQFAADVLKRAGGRIDVLVNAAGWGRVQPFVENPPEFWDQVLAINLKGPIRLTQKLLPSMFEARSGKIINISSDAGRVGSLGETVYSAAKGGAIAFSKGLAREMARFNINVNSVCPGPTDTPLLDAVPDKFKEAFIRATPMRRIAKPEEVADAVLFFASDRSSFITGQVLSVNGGLAITG